MTGPVDEVAVGAGGHSLLRTSHAEREQIIDVLKAAFVQGRPDQDEFDLRIGQALASQTRAELGNASSHAAAKRSVGLSRPDSTRLTVDASHGTSAAKSASVIPAASRARRTSAPKKRP